MRRDNLEDNERNIHANIWQIASCKWQDYKKDYPFEAKRAKKDNPLWIKIRQRRGWLAG